MLPEMYIGLMSGTSADGIDAIIIDLSVERFKIVDTYHHTYPDDIKSKIKQLSLPGDNEIDRMGELDIELGEMFADAANHIISQSTVDRSKIGAIGSHGQTLRHRPSQANPFTLQIGDPNIITERTGITTVADLRRRDMALGGQAAPLVPRFHEFAFRSDKENRCVVNIGGISNLTWIPRKKEIHGYDIGPGNTLMDSWIDNSQHQPFDKSGKWAKSGAINSTLVNVMFNDPFFALPAPKSTGPERFNLQWLDTLLNDQHKMLPPQDVQASLCELTALSISSEINKIARSSDVETSVYICGGGAHNVHLMERIRTHLEGHRMSSTAVIGIDPDWVEAAAFAWLAQQTLQKLPGNSPNVTGAKRPCVLGGIYYP